MHLVGAVPVTDGEAREERRAERGRFDHLRAYDRHAQDVRLELHEQVVGRGPTIHAQLAEIDARVLLHDVEDICHLERDAFERRAREVRGGRATRDAGHEAACVLVPVRRAEPGEGRDQVDAAGVRDGCRERLDVGRGLDQAQPVAQPLDHRAADEHAAFERVVGGVVAPPGDRRHQLMLRGHRFAADVHEHEATGAVRVLGEAAREAVLAEERRLLVPGDAGDRDGCAEDVGGGGPVDLGRRAHLRQDLARHVEQPEQFVVPRAGGDVVEHRTRGVARVGDVERALRELPDQPGVHRAEGELAARRAGARAGHVVQDPAELAGGEVGVDDQARLALDHPAVARLLPLVAEARGAAILPHDRVVDRLARAAVPHDRGFALVGDADGRDVRGLHVRLREHLGGDVALGRPDLARVVLDPARLREHLAEFLLRDSDDAAGVVEQDGARARGALVEGKDVSHLRGN